MTPEEIDKLAKEFAKEYAAREYPNAPCEANYWIVEARTESMKENLRFLLRTHCIVSKEKVRKMHDNELEFAQSYQRKANSCINQHCRIDYETSRDIVKSRAKLLEPLFDAETFKNSEV